MKTTPLAAVFQTHNQKESRKTITAAEYIAKIKKPIVCPHPVIHPYRAGADEKYTRKRREAITLFKGTLPLMLPFMGSTFNDGVFRKGKQDAISTNAFTHIRVDLDTGNYSLNDLLSSVALHYTNLECFIFSTSSSAPDDQRWRIIIPFSKPVSAGQFNLLTLQASDHFSDKPDDCVARIQQGVFAPAQYQCYEYWIASDHSAVQLYSPKLVKLSLAIPVLPKPLRTVNEGDVTIDQLNEIGLLKQHSKLAST